MAATRKILFIRCIIRMAIASYCLRYYDVGQALMERKYYELFCLSLSADY